MDTNNMIRKISKPQEIDWRKATNERSKNRKWLGYSSQVARRISAAMDKIPGMTQKKLAEKIGVKPQNISKILKGDVNLTLKTIATLATELNTELISFPFYSDEEYTVFMKLTKPDNYLGIKANHSIFKPISFNAEGYNFSEMAKLNLNE